MHRKAGWINHPATKMWEGCPHELCVYAIAICDEWSLRGYEENYKEDFLDLMQDPWIIETAGKKPFWMGSKEFHDSHKSNLYRKDPVHYKQFEYIGADLEYIWPMGIKKRKKKIDNGIQLQQVA